MNINELFKHRSVTACMKASYDLLSSNLKNLLSKTWWAFLPQALLMAIFVYLRMPNKGLHDWGEDSPMASFIFQTIVYLLTIVMGFVGAAAIWKWVNEKPFIKNLKRFFIVAICSMIIIYGIIGIAAVIYFAIIAATGAFSPSAPLASQLIAVLAGIVLVAAVLVLVLPFAYIIPRYMLLESNDKLKPWKSYKCGLRHAGSIFKLGFLGYLLFLCIGFIIETPMMVLMGVQAFSQIGVLEGDPVGVPSYFPILFIGTTTLILFISCYIGSWLFFAFNYLYGSIEHDEKEKIALQQQEANSQMPEIDMKQ